MQTPDSLRPFLIILRKSNNKKDMCKMSLWFWSIFPSYSLTPHSVFLTLLFHTIHFYDLHRPAAHFESIVVNFAQILPSCKGYISSSLWSKSTSSSSLNSSKGRRKAELPLLLRLFLYLDLSRSAPCKRAPSENVRKSGQILLPPRSNRVRKDQHPPPSHPARHQNTVR